MNTSKNSESSAAPPPRGLDVECYSGYTYAQQPRAFRLDNERRAVTQVCKRWLEPAGPRFEVLTDDGATYVLAYDELTDRWHVSAKGLIPNADVYTVTTNCTDREDSQQ